MVDSVRGLRASGRDLAEVVLGLYELAARGRGESPAGRGEAVPGIGDDVPGMGESDIDWAFGPTAGAGAVSGPVEAHADVTVTAASKYHSSALLRRLAGYMALLGGDVPAVLPVPETHSSVPNLVATRNETGGERTMLHSSAQVDWSLKEATLLRWRAGGGSRGIRYKGGTG
jgi:hypothetical protein